MVVHGSSKYLPHQLHRVSVHDRKNALLSQRTPCDVSVHDRVYRRQPLHVHLLARCLRQGVYSLAHGRRRRVDVGRRSRHRLAQSPRLVVAHFRHQDAEVSVGPCCRLHLFHGGRRSVVCSGTVLRRVTTSSSSSWSECCCHSASRSSAIGESSYTFNWPNSDYCEHTSRQDYVIPL